MYVGHFMNEVHQATTSHNGSVDAIADLLIFDWIGKLLFMNDSIANFASNKLHLTEWTYRMSLGLPSKRLLNNGQQYWMRLQLFDGLSLSFLSGNMHSSPCLTFNRLDQQLSIGLGINLEDFITQENGSPKPIAVNWGVLLAYSVSDNPYVTFTYRIKTKPTEDSTQDTSTDKNMLLNLYPSSLLDIKGFKPGLTFGFRKNAYFFGITTGIVPIGLHLEF